VASYEPHPKAEYMAAPTNAANVKKALANSEPSTHGANAKSHNGARMTAHMRVAIASAQKEYGIRQDQLNKRIAMIAIPLIAIMD
jgi:hypothetical protein